MTDLPAWVRRHGWTIVGGLVICAYFVQQYLTLPIVPGSQPASPLGWWGWFDQSKTLESARALASGDLSRGQHWYPLGYSILGAVFYPLSHRHPFAFINLASLLAVYGGFVAFARHVGVRAVWSIPLFLLATMGDRILFEQWIIPWNTTPVAALVWALLALSAAHMDGRRRPFALGVVASAVPLFRPTGVLLVAPCLLAAAAADLRQHRLYSADLRRFAAGALLLVVPYGALYLAIYRFRPSEYMLVAGHIGFTLRDLGWKAYVVLVDPRAWFGGGEGLLERCPWIVLALAGLVPALLRRRAAALLAVVLILHGLLYLTYVDLLPTGIWRYNLVHYWSLAYPGYALVAFLLLRDLICASAWRRCAVGWTALSATILLLCLRVAPVPAEEGMAAKAVDFHTGDGSFDHIYFGTWELHDERGILRNVSDVRAVPIAGGMRVISLRRPIVGNVLLTGMAGTPASATVESMPTARWREAVRLGWPSWLFAPVGHGLFDPVEPGP